MELCGPTNCGPIRLVELDVQSSRYAGYGEALAVIGGVLLIYVQLIGGVC